MLFPRRSRSAWSRLRVVAWSVLVAALALAVTALTVRAVLLAQVDHQADEMIAHEAASFVTFVEGADVVGNGEGEQYSSEAELMRSFLARQTPESHEALVTVSGGDVLFLDNAQHDAGRRFAESEVALQRVLDADSATGVLQTEEFGEVRWGRVTTDQGGALVVLHFTTPAEEEAAGTAATFAWAGAGSLLLVAAFSWIAWGWPPAARRGQVPAPGGSAPSAPTPTDPGPVPPGRDGPGLAINRQSVSAANLLLDVQRQAAAAHPSHRILLTAAASGTGSDVGGSPAPTEGTSSPGDAPPSAAVLGGLARLEAELDGDAVRAALLSLADHAVAVSPAGSAVFLTAEPLPASAMLRFSVLHAPLTPSQSPDPETGSSASVHPDDAPPAHPFHQHGTSSAGGGPSSTPQGGSLRGWELAERVAAAHHGGCWQVSGSGSPSTSGYGPSGPSPGPPARPPAGPPSGSGAAVGMDLPIVLPSEDGATEPIDRAPRPRASLGPSVPQLGLRV